MTLKDSIKTAFFGVLAHKSRAFLTVLGIVIGITAIILVMAIGQGGKDLILKQIQGLGSKTIVVLPGRPPQGPSDFAQLFSDSLKANDLNLLQRKENVPTLSKIIPVVYGSESATYGSDLYHLTFLGGSEQISDIFELYTSEGFFFTSDDVKSQASVVVLGSKVKEELFGDSPALGEKIKIKGKNFRVIGVLPKKGQVSFFNFDDIALVPYTTAQQYILGIKYFHRFIIEADSEKDIPVTVSYAQDTLRASHNIQDPSKDDFNIETQADLVGRFSVVTDILTLLLVSIAAISLVVGGIGIMNIMLVSVTERTREIGLRKAIGATSKDVMNQFLLEAVILTGAGGIIGIILGAFLSLIVSVVLTVVIGISWSFIFPLNAVILGLVVSTGVGLVFGLYPARRASAKEPIEALRYE